MIRGKSNRGESVVSSGIIERLLELRPSTRTGPDPGDVHRPDGPYVILIEGSPSFHEPGDVDDDLLEDVDVERVPLAQALQQEYPPCVHCYPDWAGDFDV